ncbi:hypothetical protein PV664_23680 [Streptomyces sp. ME01-18a]|uniref:hypothetical protein n=1 Tax=Streptomyces sp. ME01-18a TaxID=3028669 RepID=UPI00299FBDEA|nr:hypothetical protein [Streptomyces sp. ME01-18a]MDX3431926.1 hypothetical protein [Streptomyces sp. ME01-18a]WSS63334.1 hypothetical protein OG284_19935 [Streptomyces sp. NBC_01177]
MTEQTAEQTAEPAEATAPAPAPQDPPAPAPQDPPPQDAAPLDPAQAPAPVAPRPPRRVLRAALRWTAAVLVLGGLGAGTAAGITSMKRTDVPGLATRDDGRWDYPALSLPALPADAPRPYSDSNTAEVHHADLRRLLLPAPAGATVDKKLDGGWVDIARYAAEYGKDDRAALTQRLKDSALRHLTARGWTMPDGTSSRVYLLQFNSVAYSTEFHDRLFEDGSLPLAPTGTDEPAFDEDWASDAGAEFTTVRAYSEAEPYGAEQVRHGYVLAGDTLALVVQSRKGKAGTEAVPFHQTLILQDQLLG